MKMPVIRHSETFFELPPHGSPADRGSSDRYYRRARNPHKWPEGTGYGEKVTDLTPAEIAEYNKAYDEETDRKEWD